MPAYSLPGTEVGPRRARYLGIGAVVVAVVSAVVWRAVPDSEPPDQIHVVLVTSQVGEGVASGTDVRLDGVRVGTVAGIDVAQPGRQRIELNLSRSQLFGLTNAVTVDYAPGNLFGISSVQLHSATGGTALVNGSTVDLTGSESGRVKDATLSALLESTGRLTDSVLTPKLAELAAKLSHDVSAFTPMLQAIGATTRSFVDTQQLPPSELFDQMGSALGGLGPMLSGGLRVLHSSYSNRYLSTPEHIARYGELFNRMQDAMLPAATQASATGERYFGGFMPIVTAILDRLASSVSTPERSTAQLSELLDRLSGVFHDTPDGPMLNASVDLDVVPGLAGPLSDALGLHPAPGGR